LAGTQLARAYRMPTPAMYPTLDVDEHFLASRIVGKLQRGQVIVFASPRDPTKSDVKRLVGLPGDAVALRSSRLILNGKPVYTAPVSDPCGTPQMECTFWQEAIDGNSYRIAILKEEYLIKGMIRDFGPVTVPGGQLFVLGDNRDNSADSRYWGYVPIESVQAKPKVIYWSPADIGFRWNRINQLVQ
jgi:signal peptidase I